jgi:GNAT superfamily N-acetyltransferase
MTLPEVDFAVELAAGEGWNPGLDDAGCFYKTDPGGFLIGLLDGQPVGCISAVSYARQFGFIGFYIVKEEFRGRGLGIRLWREALGRLEGQNTGLDGVVAQEGNYRSSGFRTAYRNTRFEGRAGTLSRKTVPQVAALSPEQFAAVLEYDRQCFPADRAVFLRGWLEMPSAKALGFTDNGRLLGYGVIRRCRSGCKVGPLFADGKYIAGELLTGLVSGLSGNDVFYLDVPGPNAAALALVRKYGMHEVFAAVRMYTREEPSIALDKVYGVTTFELG